MSEPILFRPKSAWEARVAESIGNLVGYAYPDPPTSADDPTYKNAVCLGMRFYGGIKSITNGYLEDSAGISSLDALVDALSKLVKEPQVRQITCRIDGNISSAAVQLMPDGGVKVRCHEFSKEAFEAVYSTWLEYNKAD